MNLKKLRKIDKKLFGYEELSRALNISLASARVAASRFVQQGVLTRIKRNMYLMEENWKQLNENDSFIIANMIQVPSYISLMTTLCYYQISTHIQRDFIESISQKRTQRVTVKETYFSYTKINQSLYFGFSRINGVFIASPEKAFVDAVYLMSLKRYNFDVSSVDYGKLNLNNVNAILKSFPKNTSKLMESIWKP